MNFSQLLKFFNEKLGSSFLCAFDHASKKALNDFKCLQVIYAYVLVRSGAPMAHRATKRSTITIRTEPHACTSELPLPFFT